MQSTVAIVEVEGRYLFRWGVTSADGKWQVKCSWEGQCEEFVDGEKTSDYAIRTWIEEERESRDRRRYFMVQGDDGKNHLLHYNETLRVWFARFPKTRPGRT